MSMMRFLALALSFTAASWSSAQACTYIDNRDFATGRVFATYYPITAISRSPVLSKNTFVAVVQTEFIRQKDWKTAFGKEKTLNVLSHKIIEPVANTVLQIPNGSYIHNKGTIGGKNILDFKFWEKATIRRPIVSYPIFETSCGPEYADELTLQPDALYLVFASQNRDGKTYIQTAARLESLDDPIIDAYRKIGEDAEDAPHKMSAETYFGHVESFAEIEILECPKAEDFKYEDSRGAIGKQKDVFYAIRDKLNTTGQSLDIRNAFSYVQQMNDGPKDINFKNVECQYGDRYLYIDGDYDKYLKVNNGLIDTTKIGTRIDITGNHLISLADVKKWISAATAK